MITSCIDCHLGKSVPVFALIKYSTITDFKNCVPILMKFITDKEDRRKLVLI